MLERAPRPSEIGAGGGAQALEHLLVKEVGESLEQVEQWREVVVVAPPREREGARSAGSGPPPPGGGVDADMRAPRECGTAGGSREDAAVVARRCGRRAWCGAVAAPRGVT